MTPTMGHYSFHWHQRWGTIPSTGTKRWGTIPPTDTNDGALFLPLTPTMGHYSSH
ncbi:unnamed protein product [Staurois parvus]|uniref:Uncharacterized protein n=1 Tax=Staurois parvus TaxID=386267 RepID=A0ABN9BXB6_9NEOB|nr:unnamed protein product [Staurois parvus]